MRCIYVLCIIPAIKSIYSPNRKTPLVFMRDTLCVPCQVRPASLYTRLYLNELFASNVYVSIFRARSHPCVAPIKICVRPPICLCECNISRSIEWCSKCNYIQRSFSKNCGAISVVMQLGQVLRSSYKKLYACVKVRLE